MSKKSGKLIHLDTKEVLSFICTHSAASKDQLVTYGDIWNHFFNGQPWKGHYSLHTVANALGQVIEYCIVEKLPIMTVLVVRKLTRTMSDKAIQGVYEGCRNLKYNVGINPVAFVENQVVLAKKYVRNYRP